MRPKIAKKQLVPREPGLREPYPRAPKSISMAYPVFVRGGRGVGHLRVMLNGNECKLDSGLKVDRLTPTRDNVILYHLILLRDGPHTHTHTTKTMDIP